jgi:hypothetical protein
MTEVKTPVGKGSIYGAFRPGTGAAFTRPYEWRLAANWTGFLAYMNT